MGLDGRGAFPLSSSGLFSPGLNVVAVCQHKARAKAGCATDSLLMSLPFVLLKVSPKRSTEDHPESSSVSEYLRQPVLPLLTLSHISGPSQHQAQSRCFTDAAEGNVRCEPGPVGLDPGVLTILDVGHALPPRERQVPSEKGLAELWDRVRTVCSQVTMGPAPGSCHKRPERQSAITYDYSEEELMASIEQEYCC
ncbi:hypothetical protein J1605_021614 [Eschrichtius robustus]|uniref:Cystin-1 n=1 Tax=Eschrichtius robustus TaxID=9764 RepID=A0AB34HDT2_ESCRO|nr:hypothetical protein J1605_021614 [Eschrichtius robustus]